MMPWGLLGVGVRLHTGPGRVGLGLEPGLEILVDLGWAGNSIRVELILGLGMGHGLR